MRYTAMRQGALRSSLGVLLLLWADSGGAQTSSSYSEFQAMTVDQLKTLQIKLTYVGLQEGPIPSVAFTSTDNTLDLTKFIPFRLPAISYANDEIAVKSFAATTAQLKAVIDEVGVLPAVVAGGIAANPYVSFMMYNTVGGLEKAFQAVLDSSDALDLFNALRKGLAGNADGLRIIDEMGCFTALLEPGVPNDVTASTALTLSGVRLNRATGRYVGTATLKNNSASPIPAPVSLVLNFVGTVSLFNATGHTCATSPEGRAFVNFPLTDNALTPGATTQVTLDYENPNAEPIKPTTKVLAGPGAR
jgi:hypothetical protein